MPGRIRIERHGPRAEIVVDHPERRNAITSTMWRSLTKAARELDRDASVRVVVLRGEGELAFVSGADISQFESQRSGPEAVQRYEELAEGAQARLQNFDKPVLAMIRGYCLGAGLNIAAICDLRIAAEDARLGIPAARMGLGYRASSMKNLVEVVGAPNAREIMLTARQFTAAEAKDMGLVNKVVPVAELEKAVSEYTQTISGNAPLTMRTAKRIIREIGRIDYDAAQCRAWAKECFESEDYKEGRKAFMEKRKPVFTGK
jgi:enoyl-CoA hydratase/carnithine racemase